MIERTLDVDVAVVGAGSAGCAAAAFLAEAGRSVALLEARPIHESGACWSNMIPRWMLEESGAGMPVPPEAMEDPLAYVMISRTGPARPRLDPIPYVDVAMADLVRRLEGRARAAGVQVVDGLRHGTLELAGERPVALHGEARPSDGPPCRLRVRARLFVDATGLKGALRSQVPALAADCPEPADADLCGGANEVCEVADPDGARAYMVGLGLRAGDSCAFTGLPGHGPYSTLVIHVRRDAGSVLMTTGAIPDGTRGTGLAIQREFRAAQPWIGRGILGGAGLIPIRRPFDRPGGPGIALLGDAGCQVFSAHASGVGTHLLAARFLADAVAGLDDPGAREAVWAWAARFMRQRGPDLGAFEAFRRTTTTLTEDEVGALVGEGFLSSGLMEAGIRQRVLPPRLGEVPAIATAVLRHPSLAVRLAAMGARMAAVRCLYHAYPSRPDRTALRLWSVAVATLLGTRPDIA